MRYGVALVASIDALGGVGFEPDSQARLDLETRAGEYLLDGIDDLRRRGQFDLARSSARELDDVIGAVLIDPETTAETSLADSLTRPLAYLLAALAIVPWLGNAYDDQVSVSAISGATNPAVAPPPACRVQA